MNQEAMKTCCLTAVISGAVAGAVAQFFPNFATNLPVGTIRDLYRNPLNFALVVGVLVLLITGVSHIATEETSSYDYYSSLLHPETYGYGSSKVQFKNYLP